MDVDDAVVQAQVEEDIRTQVQALLQANGDVQQLSRSLVGLIVLLGELPQPYIPAELEKALPNIIACVASADVHVQRNACAVLTGMADLSEACWGAMIDDADLLPRLVRTLAESTDDALRLNTLATVNAIVQGGGEGAWAIADLEGMQVVMSICNPSSTERLQESAADVISQFAAHEPLRPMLVEKGAIKSLCSVLSTNDAEVRVRALLALGMLLPSSPESQDAVAKDTDAVCSLMTLMQQSEDTDSKAVARELFALLAKNPACKDKVEAAVRSTQITPP